MTAGASRPAQPFDCGTRRIEEDWANVIGHMRAHQYVALFDDANTAFLSGAGLTDASLRNGSTSPVLTDMHVCYLKEARPGDEVAFSAQVLGHDERRGRLILTMRVMPADVVAATCELAILNLDLDTRRPCPWLAGQAAIWRQLTAAHAALPVPPQAGRGIGAVRAVQDRQATS